MTAGRVGLLALGAVLALGGGVWAGLGCLVLFLGEWMPGGWMLVSGAAVTWCGLLAAVAALRPPLSTARENREVS